MCVSKTLVKWLCKKGLAKVPVHDRLRNAHTRRAGKVSATPFTVVYSGRMLEEQKRISLILATLESAYPLIHGSRQY
ncbi:MAG: hypothetical protein IPO87_10765 [Flavobacteriales bacterium]|nr:hypothetical protein [Flavobacteriales bacterium]